MPIATLPIKAAHHTTMAQDTEKAEHFVRVKWLKTVPLDEAVREKGFFGNQNSAAQPRAKRWQHTIERLKQRFGIQRCRFRLEQVAKSTGGRTRLDTFGGLVGGGLDDRFDFFLPI